MLMRAMHNELLLAFRRRAELVNPLVFFVLVCALFPLALGPDAGLLAPLASGILWVAALLATLLSLDQMFRQDFEDGILEQMELSPLPFYQLVTLKILAHWIMTGLPLVLLSPLLALMLFLPAEGYLPLVAGLLLGTPTLSLIGSVGAALGVGMRRGSLVVALLIAPLYVPVLIFGATSPLMAVAGGVPLEQFLWLSALLVFSATLAPLATSLILRVYIRCS